MNSTARLRQSVSLPSPPFPPPPGDAVDRVVHTKLMVLDLSASTQYTLLYNGQRYNSVTAEYV
jgi:hypothetical protein